MDEDANEFRDPEFSSYKPIKCGTQIRKVVRLADMYALPITLRFKSEKLFYTNLGACVSIALYLTMIGLFMSELFTMLSKSKIEKDITTILSTERDIEIQNNGLFLFGYRFVDITTNEVFSDTTILKGVFSTEQKTWQTASELYEVKPTVYKNLDCLTVIKDELLQKPEAQSVKINEQPFGRLQMDTFTCPS